MKRISDAQRAVLREVFSDAELASDFLTKVAGFIYLTTNANDCKIKFEGGSGLQYFRGEFKYKSYKPDQGAGKE